MTHSDLHHPTLSYRRSENVDADPLSESDDPESVTAPAQAPTYSTTSQATPVPESVNTPAQAPTYSTTYQAPEADRHPFTHEHLPFHGDPAPRPRFLGPLDRRHPAEEYLPASACLNPIPSGTPQHMSSKPHLQIPAKGIPVPRCGMTAPRFIHNLHSHLAPDDQSLCLRYPPTRRINEDCEASRIDLAIALPLGNWPIIDCEASRTDLTIVPPFGNWRINEDYENSSTGLSTTTYYHRKTSRAKQDGQLLSTRSPHSQLRARQDGQVRLIRFPHSQLRAMQDGPVRLIRCPQSQPREAR